MDWTHCFHNARFCKSLPSFAAACTKGKRVQENSLSLTRQHRNCHKAGGSYGLIFPVTTFEETSLCLICNICHRMNHNGLRGCGPIWLVDRFYRFVTNERRMPTSRCMCINILNILMKPPIILELTFNSPVIFFFQLLVLIGQRHLSARKLPNLKWFLASVNQCGFINRSSCPFEFNQPALPSLSQL